LDFGDDTSIYARDGECDDIRFEGSGMAQDPLSENIGRDASDCRASYSAGTVKLNRLFIRPASIADIIFGDDTSKFAGDGECDDIRFAGAHSAMAIYLSKDVGHDAADCQAGFDAGYLRWQGDLANPVRGLSWND